MLQTESSSIILKPMQLQDSDKDLTTQKEEENLLCSAISELSTNIDQDMSFLRTSQEYSPKLTELHSIPYSKGYPCAGTMTSHGVLSMQKISTYPRQETDCFLWHVLEAPPVAKEYYLSRRGCQGILDRMKNRGKKIPETLKTALENQVALSSEP